jgi:hypothetical protein
LILAERSQIIQAGKSQLQLMDSMKPLAANVTERRGESNGAPRAVSSGGGFWDIFLSEPRGAGQRDISIRLSPLSGAPLEM